MNIDDIDKKLVQTVIDIEDVLIKIKLFDVLYIDNKEIKKNVQ